MAAAARKTSSSIHLGEKRFGCFVLFLALAPSHSVARNAIKSSFYLPLDYAKLWCGFLLKKKKNTKKNEGFFFIFVRNWTLPRILENEFGLSIDRETARDSSLRWDFKKKSISVTIKGPQLRLFLKHLLFFSCLLYFLYFLLFVHYCLMAILEYLRAKRKVLHCGRYSFASSLFRNLFLHWIVFFLSHRKQEAFGSFFFYVFFLVNSVHFRSKRRYFLGNRSDKKKWKSKRNSFWKKEKRFSASIETSTAEKKRRQVEKKNNDNNNDRWGLTISDRIMKKLL